MINITALDNIIALVVVILLLSLIVQSIQSVLKKALKIKSRQIEDSLMDLFETVLHYNPSPANVTDITRTPEGAKALDKPRGKMSAWLVRVTGPSPILRRVYEFISRAPHPYNPSAHPDPTVRALFDEVIRGFQQIGRVAQTGNRMLDSVSKDDLKKVMGKVLPNSLLPGSLKRLEEACARTGDLDGAVKRINDNYLGSLSGDANAKFAAMQQSLSPLLNDLRSVYAGQQVSPALIIEDVINLRDIKLGDALAILGEVQQKVEADLAKANLAQAGGTPPAPGVIAGLTGLSEALKEIAQALIRLSEGLDAAITPLRAKLNEVEAWYDTVMQSFEERYTRGMKTWAIVISFLVVAYLNANVFDIYRNISTNDALRNQLIQAGEERLKANEQRLAKAKEGRDEQQVNVTLEEIKKDEEAIKNQVAEYSGFGFRPLSWQAVKERLDPKSWSAGGWLNRRKGDLKTLGGWIVMTFLLSVGAPFWQDALESLFGVKNLLRKSSDTKNVEDKSGAGQTRS
jgi:hypothetical protein